MLRKSAVRLIVVGSLLVAVAAVAAIASEDSRAFRVRDDCDAASFNAVIGDGTCVGDGDTTFTKFINELTEDRQVGAWRFNPDDTRLDRGQKTILESRAGEFHTFTRVAKFGGGIVQILNDLSGNPTVAPECGAIDNLAPPTATNRFVFPGSAFPGPAAGSTDLPKGTTTWQCCIHPWMRTTITVK
jgi:hypothetical protein